MISTASMLSFTLDSQIVCMCLYPSTVETSSAYNNIVDILECTKQQICAVGII